MKFNIAFLLLMPMMLSCETNKEEALEKAPTDLAEMNLNGKVKSIRRYDYSAKMIDGSIEKEVIMVTVLVRYNNEGNETYSMINDGPEGSYVDQQIERSYDTQGNVILVKRSDLEGKVKSTDRCDFDPMGNEVKWSYYIGSDRLNSDRTSIYDESSRLIEQKKRTNIDNGNPATKTYFSYNNEGLLIEKNSDTGNQNVRIKYRYDADRNIIEEITNHSGGYNSYQNFKHDGRGNVIEERYSSEIGQIDWSRTTRFDNRENKIEHASYGADGNVETRWEWKYNDNDDCIEDSRFDPTGQIELGWYYTYEYDAMKNWTTQIVRKQTPNGLDEFEVCERTIEYY